MSLLNISAPIKNRYEAIGSPWRQPLFMLIGSDRKPDCNTKADMLLLKSCIHLIQSVLGVLR